jgi:hypothetical protein
VVADGGCFHSGSGYCICGTSGNDHWLAEQASLDFDRGFLGLFTVFGLGRSVACAACYGSLIVDTLAGNPAKFRKLAFSRRRLDQMVPFGWVCLA